MASFNYPQFYEVVTLKFPSLVIDQGLFDFRAPPPSRFPCESSGVLAMAGLERILGGVLGLQIGSDTKAQMSYGCADSVGCICLFYWASIQCFSVVLNLQPPMWPP